ncbi:MAG: Rrf2 family transcriptional regulator [Phycisphaeraceae bacterium]|nr:Rrf2 family transcriptional regulator [Phycisphaeraceae bacterium]
MLSLTRKTDYALVALARLAADSHNGSSTPVSAREIAEAHGLPLPLMMNILKKLHRAGLISSTRGIHGGYVLTHEPRAIRLTTVIEAIEGPLRVAACCHDEDPAAEHESDAARSCPAVKLCPITDSVRLLNQNIRAYLHGYTLADLLAGLPDVPPVQEGMTLSVSAPRRGSTN